MASNKIVKRNFEDFISSDIPLCSDTDPFSEMNSPVDEPYIPKKKTNNVESNEGNQMPEMGMITANNEESDLQKALKLSMMDQSGEANEDDDIQKAIQGIYNQYNID